MKCRFVAPFVGEKRVYFSLVCVQVSMNENQLFRDCIPSSLPPHTIEDIHRRRVTAYMELNRVLVVC